VSYCDKVDLLKNATRMVEVKAAKEFRTEKNK